MLFDWSDILPHAIENLSPLHQEIVNHVMNQPGRSRLPYTFARRQWNLDRKQFDIELQAAYDSIRLYLRRFGLRDDSDLEFQ